MKALFLLFLALCSIAHSAEYTHCRNIDENTQYRLYWTFTSSSIRFMMQAETAGWIGLGLSNGGSHPMISNGNMSDIWVGWVDTQASSPCSSGCVYDYHVAIYQQPTLDPSTAQSLTLISANFSSANGVTTVEFERPLVTGDPYDQDIVLDGLTTFIWALNPSSRAIPTTDGSSFLKHNADTKGSLTINLNAPSTCTAFPTTATNSFTNADGAYKVDWAFGSDTITFTVSATTKGWVGLGLSQSSSMPNSDIYVGWIDPSGKAIVTDRYATQYAMPSLDTSLGGKDDIIQASPATNGDPSITSFTFTRPLNTGDKNDVAIVPGTISLLWAYGSDDSVDYAKQTFSQHVAKGVIQIDLFSGNTTPTPRKVDLYQVHGVLMVVSICLFLFPGILIARFFKLLIPKWFYIHATLQILGYSGILAAFIVVFVAKNGMFVIGLHQVCGLIIFSLFGIELVFGFAAHFTFRPNRLTPPVFPDKTHWWLGRAVFIFSLLNIYLGLRAYEATFAAKVIYMLWVLVAIVGVAYLQKTVGQTHETKQIKLNESDDEFMLTDLEEDSGTPGKHHGQIGGSMIYKKPVIALIALVVISCALLLVGFVYKTRPPPTLPSVDGKSQVSINFSDYVVPTKSTNYICKGFVLPSDKDYHIIQFDPIKDNQEMLHHMILYATDNFVGDDYVDCTSMPAGASPLFAWAVGMNTFAPPNNVGFRIGKTSAKYVALQIHYDNPNMWSGRTDSSGVKLTITSQLRPIDAGYFVTGIKTGKISIPAHQPYYEMTGTCDTSTVSAVDKNQVYTIFSSGLHMHTMGRQIYTKQFRPDANGKLQYLGNVGCDDYFSFNDQKFTNINATMRAGDVFITHCIYDSSTKAEETKGCESTDCEMCINYMAYYPKLDVPKASCNSPPTLIKNNATILQCA